MKEKVFQFVSRIPKGKVTTYGEIAYAVGSHPRAVGTYLHQNDNPEEVPCHRVVNSKGRLAPGYVFGGSGKQAERLQKEGIIVKNNYVNLQQYLWEGDFNLPS